MRMTDKKLLSIGFVTFNGGARVRSALDSLVSQNYKNFELLISDNASTDADTERICRDFAAKDSRIRYFRQRENIGRINNFLFVLGEARGDYFLWAADDDWRDESFAAVLIAGLERDRRFGVALSSFRRVYSDGEPLDEILFSGKNSTTNESHFSLYKRTLLYKYLNVEKKIMLYQPLHVFFCGIWRIEFLRSLMNRPVPDCRSWDRILLAEAALATKFYSVPDTLFTKSKNKISIKTRHVGDTEQQRYSKPFSYIRYIFILLGRMVFSPVIPIHRKILIPIPWLMLIWAERKRIIGLTLRDARRVFAASKLL